MKRKFLPIEAKAWRGLMKTYAHLMKKMESGLMKDAKLSNQEFEVLLELSWSAQGKLRLQTLSSRSLLTRSGITRLVDRLETKGYLKRLDVPGDGRGAYAQLTPSGRVVFAKAKRGHIALVHEIFLQYFNEDELSLLAEFWRRVLGDDETETDV